MENYCDIVFDRSDVDIFFHTWNDDLLIEPKIVSDLNPKNYSISEPVVDSSDPDMIKRGTSRQRSVYYSMQQLQEEDIDKYDYLIFTRFDLHFDMNVVKLLEQTDAQFGAGFKTELYTRNNETDDNFFFVEPEKYEFFKNGFLKYISENTRKRNLHLLPQFIKDNFGLDYGFLIEDGEYNVNVDNPLYHIVRYAAPHGTENWKFVSSPKNNKVDNCEYCVS